MRGSAFGGRVPCAGAGAGSSRRAARIAPRCRGACSAARGTDGAERRGWPSEGGADAPQPAFCSSCSASGCHSACVGREDRRRRTVRAQKVRGRCATIFRRGSTNVNLLPAVGRRPWAVAMRSEDTAKGQHRRVRSGRRPGCVCIFPWWFAIDGSVSSAHTHRFLHSQLSHLASWKRPSVHLARVMAPDGAHTIPACTAPRPAPAEGAHTSRLWITCVPHLSSQLGLPQRFRQIQSH